jgi:ribosomal protein S14
MDFHEMTDWCDVCYTRTQRLGIRLLVTDDPVGAFICRQCVKDMAEQLGILKEYQEEILEILR